MLCTNIIYTELKFLMSKSTDQYHFSTKESYSKPHNHTVSFSRRYCHYRKQVNTIV